MAGKLYCCKFRDYSKDLDTSMELLCSLELQSSTWLDHEDQNLVTTQYIVHPELSTFNRKDCVIERPFFYVLL